MKKNEFKLHIQSKYRLKLSRAYEDYDHGIVTCVLLMKYLVYFLESDFLLDDLNTLNLKDQKQFQIRREILRSIAVHNCSNIYHLTVNNFQFFLTFIDELQQWGRPSGRITKHSSGWSVTLHKFDEDNIDYTITTENVHTNEQFRSIFFKICNKFTQIFRGAVGGHLRNFDVHFKLLLSRDEAERSFQKKKYTRIVSLEYFHKRPKSVESKDNQEKNEVSYYDIDVTEHYLSKDFRLKEETLIPYHNYEILTKKKMDDTIEKIFESKKE